MAINELLLVFIVILFIPYTLIISYFNFVLFRLKYSIKSKAQYPVSVVVSVHNEQENIEPLLVALSSQDYPADLCEFIIVNDRSTDNSEKIINTFCRKDRRFKLITIHELDQNFGPKKRAIDTAIRQAAGDIILLTDADGRPADSWIKEMVSYYDDGTDMVIGYAPYSVSKKDSRLKRLLALEYLSHAVVAAASTAANFPLTCVGTNMSYRKKVYLELDGFGPYKQYISGDDDLFLTRVRESKVYSIRYATHPETNIYNNAPGSWKQFFHQRMRYASKGFVYPKKVTLGLSIYFLLNLLLLCGFFSFLVSTELFIAILLVFLSKATVETLFMNNAAKVLSDRRFIKLMPLAQLLHIPYIVGFAILGQFQLFKWGDSK